MKAVHNLAKLFDMELHSDLKSVLIIKQHNKYLLYGRFTVMTDEKDIYVTNDSLTKEQAQFSALKHAVAWCILIQSSKWKDARRLASLDLRLTSLLVDTSIHRNLLKNATTFENKTIFRTKLQEDSFRRRLIIDEIDTILHKSKRVQDRNFETVYNKKTYQRDKYNINMEEYYETY